MTNSNPQIAGISKLILVTVIWGATFPLNAFISHDIDPILAIAARFAIAALPLLGLLRKLNRALVIDGMVLGGFGCLMYIGQMMSLQGASVNRAAILSSLHIVIVPVILKLMGRNVSLKTFGISGLALAGVIAMKPDLSLSSWAVSDAWAFLGALGFALMTIRYEACAKRHDSLRLSAVQISTMAVVLLAMAIPSLHQIPVIVSDFKILGSLVYLGLGATLAATLLQAQALRHVASCQSSAILSLEPVATAGFAWGLVGQAPSGHELFGGLLVMVAGFLMNVPVKFPVLKVARLTRVRLTRA